MYIMLHLVPPVLFSSYFLLNLLEEVLIGVIIPIIATRYLHCYLFLLLDLDLVLQCVDQSFLKDHCKLLSFFQG
jgi:hypothetical protein